MQVIFILYIDVEMLIFTHSRNSIVTGYLILYRSHDKNTDALSHITIMSFSSVPTGAAFCV
jgi:hypothetical protein